MEITFGIERFTIRGFLSKGDVLRIRQHSSILTSSIKEVLLSQGVKIKTSSNIPAPVQVALSIPNNCEEDLRGDVYEEHQNSGRMFINKNGLANITGINTRYQRARLIRVEHRCALFELVEGSPLSYDNFDEWSVVEADFLLVKDLESKIELPNECHLLMPSKRFLRKKWCQWFGVPVHTSYRLSHSLKKWFKLRKMVLCEGDLVPSFEGENPNFILRVTNENWDCKYCEGPYENLKEAYEALIHECLDNGYDASNNMLLSFDSHWSDFVIEEIIVVQEKNDRRKILDLIKERDL